MLISLSLLPHALDSLIDRVVDLIVVGIKFLGGFKQNAYLAFHNGSRPAVDLVLIIIINVTLLVIFQCH